MHHAGKSDQYPETCDCSNYGPDDYKKCNHIDLLVGLIVYDSTKNSSYTNLYSEEFRPFLPIIEYYYVPPVVNGADTNAKVYPGK